MRLCVRHQRHVWFCRWNERPMSLEFRALCDPRLERLDLLGLKRFVRFRRRHHLLAVVRTYPEYRFALSGLAGHDGINLVDCREESLASVEAQIRFALLRI